MHENDTGVSQDHTEAARLYQLGADQGHTQAQSNLALLYLKSTGVPQDLTKATCRPGTTSVMLPQIILPAPVYPGSGIVR